jgi:hypothetical protein
MRPRLTRAIINQRLRYRRIEMTGDYSGPKVKAGFRCDHCGFCWVTSWGCIEWGCGCPSCKDINIEKFVNSFKENFKEVSFRKAKLKGLSFSKYTSGNLEVESSRDALLDINGYFTNSSYLLDKAKFFLIINELSYCIEVSSSGTIIFDEDIFENIITATYNL